MKKHRENMKNKLEMEKCLTCNVCKVIALSRSFYSE